MDVRLKPFWPDELQKSSALSGQNAIHRTNCAKDFLFCNVIPQGSRRMESRNNCLAEGITSLL